MGRVPVVLLVVTLLASSSARADCAGGGERGFLGNVLGAVTDARHWVEDRADDARDVFVSGREAAARGGELLRIQTSDDLFPWIRKPGPGTPASVAPCNGRTGGLKVMSYNIRSTRESSLDQIARDINASAPDFVALQEVDVKGLRTARKDQPAELARRTGLRHHAFGRAADRGFLIGDYGNAILSRFPILQVRTWKLPSKDEQRVMICATIAAPAGETTACSVHLGLDADERQRQVEVIDDIVAGFPTDRVVLLGDFNARPDAAPMRFLRRRGWVDAWEVSGSGQPNTSNARSPNRRIDFILTRDGSGLDPQCTHVPNVTGSDHRPVVSTIH